jgi:hypothetical protein
MAIREEHLFIRQYLPPESGRSMNHSTREMLPGVSAYYCIERGDGFFQIDHDCDWKLQIDIGNVICALSALGGPPNAFFPDDPDLPKLIFFLVQGDRICVGPDTEPLVSNVSVLFPLVPDRNLRLFRRATREEQCLLKRRYGGSFRTEDEIHPGEAKP